MQYNKSYDIDIGLYSMCIRWSLIENWNLIPIWYQGWPFLMPNSQPGATKTTCVGGASTDFFKLSKLFDDTGSPSHELNFMIFSVCWTCLTDWLDWQMFIDASAFYGLYCQRGFSVRNIMYMLLYFDVDLSSFYGHMGYPGDKALWTAIWEGRWWPIWTHTLRKCC